MMSTIPGTARPQDEHDADQNAAPRARPIAHSPPLPRKRPKSKYCFMLMPITPYVANFISRINRGPIGLANYLFFVGLARTDLNFARESQLRTRAGSEHMRIPRKHGSRRTTDGMRCIITYVQRRRKSMHKVNT